MKRHYAVPALIPAALAAAAIAFTHAAFAAQRAFVSGSGADANPCTISLPCRSFAAAIAQANAGGEVVVLDSAGYGPFAVGKSVTIVAPAGIYAGITVTSGDGVTVNAPGANVTLRGLTINGQGGTFGIRVQAAARVRIDRCTIAGMSGNGIQLVSPGTDTTVTDTTIRDSTTGIAMLAGAPLALARVRSENNSAQGLAISAPPGSPPLTATVSDSAFTGNGQNGIDVAPSGNTEARVHVERSVIAYNGENGFVAGAFTPGATVRATLARNAIGHNEANGVLVNATDPGNASAFVEGNAFEGNVGSSIDADGNHAAIFASDNAGESVNPSPTLECVNGGALRSLGNNDVGGVGASPSGCYTVGAGF